MKPYRISYTNVYGEEKSRYMYATEPEAAMCWLEERTMINPDLGCAVQVLSYEQANELEAGGESFTVAEFKNFYGERHSE